MSDDVQKYSEAFLDAARYCEDEDMSNMRCMFAHQGLCQLIDFKLLVDPESGRSPLMMAAGNGHLECLAFLLVEVGVNVNHQNISGNTALHWAALNGHVDCVSLLIAHGADVNLANSSGRTPFDEALIRDKKDCCEVIAKKEVELIMLQEDGQEDVEEIDME